MKKAEVDDGHASSPYTTNKQHKGKEKLGRPTCQNQKPQFSPTFRANISS